jgi:hypothetical protein
LISYCSDDCIHSKLKLTFKEVALHVLNYINRHKDKQQLEIILEEEISSCSGKCFQGRLSRLINVLNGYCSDVNINISDNEQIGNIIIMLKSKYKQTPVNVDELIDMFVKEMNEREYNKDIIDEWIIHIRENY